MKSANADALRADACQLQARMQDLNRLLVASQGVASSLTPGDALRHVLDAVIAKGPARQPLCWSAIFCPAAASTPARFADGPEQDVYMHLDHQIPLPGEKQERMVMATVSRSRGLILTRTCLSPNR